MATFKKSVLGVAGVLLFILIAVGAFMYYGNYSDGFRAGSLLKLSRKGMVFKTWEGELSQGFLEQNVDQGGVATKIWPFSVRGSDETTLTRLQEAMARGQRVKLHYDEKYIKVPWVGDTKYVVNEVEVIQP